MSQEVPSHWNQDVSTVPWRMRPLQSEMLRLKK